MAASLAAIFIRKDHATIKFEGKVLTLPVWQPFSYDAHNVWCIAGDCLNPASLAAIFIQFLKRYTHRMAGLNPASLAAIFIQDLRVGLRL